MLVFSVFVIASQSPVLLAPMVETEPAHDYDEPRSKLSAPVISICTETVKIVTTKLAQNECVAIHHVVVFAAERTGNI